MPLAQLKKFSLDLLFVMIFFCAAFATRLYKIEEITPGMWGDELTVGKMSEHVWELPEFTPFIDTNYGHPTPLLYLGGMFIHQMGRSLTSIRMVSVLFGALDVSLMYICLRCFFDKKTAVFVTTIFTFSYAHFTLSRLAYEMTAAIFFELLFFLFLYQFWKKSRQYWLVLAGAAVGVGLFTYLGFRTFAIAATILTCVVVCKKSAKNLKQNKQIAISFGIFLLTAIITSLPLLMFGIQHPDQINARAVSISVFHQHLASVEVIKEIGGSAWRSFGVMGWMADPNLRQNPAHTFMFNPIILVISAVGLYFLARKKLTLFFIAICFLLTSFVNDVFSVEFIPELHYYGFGHPNTLRLFGLIPIIFFLFAFGVDYLSKISKRFAQTKTSHTVMLSFFFGLVGLISIWLDFSSYFLQPLSQYNYTYNKMQMLHIAEILNQSGKKEALGSDDLLADQYVQYFKHQDISLKELKLNDTTTFEQLPKNSFMIINPNQHIPFARNILAKMDASPNLPIQLAIDPWQHVEIIIIDTHH